LSPDTIYLHIISEVAKASKIVTIAAKTNKNNWYFSSVTRNEDILPPYRKYPTQKTAFPIKKIGIRKSLRYLIIMWLLL